MIYNFFFLNSIVYQIIKIKYYDNIYKDIAKGKELEAWSRDNIEYHILQTISDKGNGVYFKKQLEGFENWYENKSETS